MPIFSILILGCALYLYSTRFLEAPIPRWVRLSLSGLRLAFLILLLYLLARPQVPETERREITPTLYVALDNTHSMSFPAHPGNAAEGEPSRWQTAVEALACNGGLIETWTGNGFGLRFGLFSQAGGRETPMPWSANFPLQATPAHSRTDISAAIRGFHNAVRADESAYLLLFTDGQWNEGANPAIAASAQPVPDAEGAAGLDRRVYAFGIGTTEPIFDVLIDSFNLPSNIRKGDGAEARIRALSRGGGLGSQAVLRLRGTRDGEAEWFYEEQPLEFNENGEAEAVFSIPAAVPGDYEFTADIPPLENELFEDNNRAAQGMRVRDEQDRILLLTSAPDFEFKFLNRVLEERDAIRPVPYLSAEGGISSLGGRNWARQRGAAAPETDGGDMAITDWETLLESLDGMGAVVLHNFAFRADRVDFANALSAYIENGGGVLSIPGNWNTAPSASTVREALPPALAQVFASTQNAAIVDLQQAAGSPLLRDANADSLQSMPPLSPLYQTILPQGGLPGGQPLLEGTLSNSQPFTLAESYRYGLGRIVVMHTNSFWRWDMLTGENVLSAFWLSTLFQCAPDIFSTAGELYTDGYVYEVNTPVRITYTARETIREGTASGVPVAIEGPAGSESAWLERDPNSPGRYEGVFTPAAPGRHTASVPGLDAEAIFLAEPRLRELRDLRQNVASLREIAEAGGGEYANQPAWAGLAERLPKTSRVIEETRMRFLGEKWWMIAMIMGLLTLEWFVRWRKGLP